MKQTEMTISQKIEAIKSNTKTSVLIDQMFELMEKLQYEGLESETEQLIEKLSDALATEQKFLDKTSKQLSLEIIKTN